VKVPRGDKLLEWAIQVMKVHADRKAILEVEFTDEEGTGLGPTLEFFALVAAELQRKDLCMWYCDDDLNASDSDLDDVMASNDSHKKPPGYYIRREGGLFPSPLPQDGELCEKVSQLFWFLGVFLAKTLQDNRLVDLPLSRPFLKLMCQGEISSAVKQRANITKYARGSPNPQEEDPMTSSIMSTFSEESDLDTSGEKSLTPHMITGSSSLSEEGSPWFASILSAEDLIEIDPMRGKFLLNLQELAAQKQNLLATLDETDGGEHQL